MRSGPGGRAPIRHGRRAGDTVGPAAPRLPMHPGRVDVLQSVARPMPTAHELAWTDALHGAGLAGIEVGSFVPATCQIDGAGR